MDLQQLKLSLAHMAASVQALLSADGVTVLHQTADTTPKPAPAPAPAPTPMLDPAALLGDLEDDPSGVISVFTEPTPVEPPKATGITTLKVTGGEIHRMPARMQRQMIATINLPKVSPELEAHSANELKSEARRMERQYGGKKLKKAYAHPWHKDKAAASTQHPLLASVDTPMKKKALAGENPKKVAGKKTTKKSVIKAKTKKTR